MSLAQSQLHSSIDEYLQREREAAERHEWLDGLIYAMAGESAQHSLICANITIALGMRLRGTQCAVYSPNMKVYSGRVDSRSGLFSYPDCLVVCGPAQFHDEHRDVLINPRVIIEVLSPSTERYDRGKKFMRYQQNQSLTDYVLIAQTYTSIEHYSRQADGRRLYEITNKMDATVLLESISCEAPLAEVYDRIEFTEADEDEPFLFTEQGS